jgi:hypothetical protein
MFLSKTRVAVILGSIFLNMICFAQDSDTSKEDETIDRQQATYALVFAINEMRVLNDLQARVSLAESILPLLSKSRPQSCREMLDEIFSDALRERKELTSSSNANLKSLSDSKLNTEKKPNPDAIIRNLIKIAGKFDPALAKKYVEEYTAEKESEKKTQSPLRDELKLALATEMVESDPIAAVTLATQALSSEIAENVLIFLATLRKKDRSLADNFAITVMRSIEVRRGSNDYNEFLVIFAYVFTPQLIPSVRSVGLVYSSVPTYQAIAESYPPSSILVQQFMQSNMRVLLNPNRYATALSEFLASRALGDYYLLSMLEPYQPSFDLVAAIRKQRSAISQYLRPDQIEKATAQIERWNGLRSKSNSISPKSNPRDTDYFSKRADEEKDPKLKDQFYYHAASNAVRERKFEAALQLVEKMSADYRERAQEFINYQIALQTIRDGSTEQAEKYLARESNLLRRAYLLTLMADSLAKSAKKDTGRASELLTEATVISTKLDTDKERAAILFGCAQIYSRFDSGRAFEILNQAITAANKLESYDGNNYIVSYLEIAGFSFDYSLYFTELTFGEAIDQLAKVSFGETYQGIKEIKGLLPRMKALVIACKVPLAKSETDKN